MSVATRGLALGSVASAAIGGSLLHPLTTGQAAATTHQGDPIGDGLLWAAACFVSLAFLLGFAGLFLSDPAWLDRLALRRRATSTTTKRVATVAVVGLVVTTAALSSVGGPASPTGTVEAAVTINEECSNSDLLVTGATLFTSEYFKDKSDRCLQSTTSEPVENLTRTDVAASALGSASTHETFITSQENFANDAKGVMWAKAKMTIVNELNNGSSEQEVMDAANATVTDYTADLEQNVISDWNARLITAAYWADATGATYDGFNDHDGDVIITDGSATNDVYNDTVTYDYQLSDGTNVTAHALGIHHLQSTTYYVAILDSGQAYEGSAEPWNLSDPNYNVPIWDYYRDIKLNTGDGEGPVMLADTGRYNALLEDYQTKEQSVHDNVAEYVSGVYPSYQAGDITLEDLAANDPQTIGTQAATDYNSTGYYGLASSQLAALGLSGNTTTSHVVSTTWTRKVSDVENGTLVWDNRSVNVTGTLFYTGDDEQQFVTGTEYDPDNLNGVVYISVANVTNTSTGNESEFSGAYMSVTENFTVQSATNTKTGESVATTTMETRNYSTTNTSQLEEDIQRLKDQRDFYEQQLSAAGGGGSGGSSNTALIAAIAVAAGAALMYRRDDD